LSFSTLMFSGMRECATQTAPSLAHPASKESPASLSRT
jgi:hypothetical protein